MTTIVIDFKNQIVAADTRATRESKVTSAFGRNPKEWSSFHTTSKIHVHGDKVIVGSGRVSDIDTFLYFYPRKPCNPVAKGTAIFVVEKTSDGLDVLLFESVEVKRRFRKSTFKWKMSHYNKSEGCMTTGSGSDFAFGAFLAGATAKEAIVVASKADPHTNDKVDVYDFTKECLTWADGRCSNDTEEETTEVQQRFLFELDERIL